MRHLGTKFSPTFHVFRPVFANFLRLFVHQQRSNYMALLSSEPSLKKRQFCQKTEISEISLFPVFLLQTRFKQSQKHRRRSENNTSLFFSPLHKKHDG